MSTNSLSSSFGLYIATALREHVKVQEFLSTKSADEINRQDTPNKRTPFMVACSLDDIFLVADYLDCDKVDLNVQDKDGMTGLMLAVQSGSLTVTIQLLAHKGHKQNKSRVRGVMPHTVVDATVKCNQGKSALAIAVESKNLVITKRLLDTGLFDVNAEDKDGLFPLMAAVKGLLGDNGQESTEAGEGIVSALVAHKDIDVNKTYKGSTSLLMACMARSVPAVKALLSHPDIDVNFIRPDGAFPLKMAICFVSVEIVKLLLEHPNILINQVCEHKKESAMAAAIRWQSITAVGELLKHPQLEVTAPEDSNLTLVHEACTKGCTVELLKLLLTHPRMKLNNATGTAAVACAARGGHVHLLLHLFNEEKIIPNPNSGLYRLAVQETKSDHARRIIQYAATAPDTATGPKVSWLAARLLEAGYDVTTARDCHQKLVVQEGIISETVLTEIPSALFGVDYLRSVDIKGLGLQCRLVQVFHDLYFARFGVRAPPPALPTRALHTSGSQNDTFFPSITEQASQAYHALLTTLNVSQCTESLNLSTARSHALHAAAPVVPAPSHTSTPNGTAPPTAIAATTANTPTTAATSVVTPPSTSAQALNAFHSLLEFLPSGQCTDALVAMGTKSNDAVIELGSKRRREE